jgi:hypothetical protein
MAETESTEKKKGPKGEPRGPKISKPRAEQKCEVASCKRPYRAKGYCNVHYREWRHHAEGMKKGRYKICTKEGCRKPRLTTGGSVCQEHAAGGDAAAAS